MVKDTPEKQHHWTCYSPSQEPTYHHQVPCYPSVQTNKDFSIVLKTCMMIYLHLSLSSSNFFRLIWITTEMKEWRNSLPLFEHHPFIEEQFALETVARPWKSRGVVGHQWCTKAAGKSFCFVFVLLFFYIGWKVNFHDEKWMIGKINFLYHFYLLWCENIKVWRDRAFPICLEVCQLCLRRPPPWFQAFVIHLEWTPAFSSFWGLREKTGSQCLLKPQVKLIIFGCHLSIQTKWESRGVWPRYRLVQTNHIYKKAWPMSVLLAHHSLHKMNPITW